ncbi:MAG TPA: hypothetical protein VF017_18285 [Thermoanaerobaculia bacterium]|nr:hypothetical protein [Thermoanaerobaculia bacterium]
MSQAELLQLVAETLDRLEVHYLVTGSVASIVYGEPRFTNDIDIVVQLSASEVAGFCRQFPQETFFFSPEAVYDAIARRGQFNLLHPSSGLKVDFFVAQSSPFDRSRFARRRAVAVTPGKAVSFAAPEDVILKKLAFYREGGSEKHLRDITGILKISGDQLDREYLEDWVARLDLGEIWQAVLERVGDG